MGGMGSGNWWRWQRKKSTIEESLSLAVKDLRRWLYPDTAGTLTWTWAGGGKSSIGFFVTGNHDTPTVTLHYRWRDAEDVRIPVQLTTTPTQFGGKRWWFICPLTVNGIVCNRRAGMLYLPPGARYFGCRKSHDLTYRSCQKAHGRNGCSAGLVSALKSRGRSRNARTWAGKMEAPAGLSAMPKLSNQFSFVPLVAPTGNLVKSRGGG